MSVERAIADRPAPHPAPAADSIYFLMFDGWQRELRSNRWHYATRWARHLPVVLVQPTLPDDRLASVSQPEPRFPNCRILHVRSVAPAETFTSGLVQAQQILSDMESNRYERPILWIYNADYVVASGLLPAVVRIYHATENYFYFDDVSPGFLTRLKGLLAMSDLVIGVSEGVVASHRPFTPGRTEVITNGCDYRHYAQAGTDRELASARGQHAKIAVYVGNINARLDLDLIDACARSSPAVLFALFGPVAGLTAEDAEKWRTILALPNARHFGVADIDRLPAIYGTADVGLIPYRRIPILVDNTFPLKAFEMQATGLPVVSTSLRALEPHVGPGLRIAYSSQEFVAAVNATARGALLPSERNAVALSSQLQDYDRKFEQVLNLVTQIAAVAEAPRAPGADLLGLEISSGVSRALDEAVRPRCAPRAGLASAVRQEIERPLLPYWNIARQIVPTPLRQRIRRLLQS